MRALQIGYFQNSILMKMSLICEFINITACCVCVFSSPLSLFQLELCYKPKSQVKSKVSLSNYAVELDFLCHINYVQAGTGQQELLSELSEFPTFWHHCDILQKFNFSFDLLIDIEPIYNMMFYDNRLHSMHNNWLTTARHSEQIPVQCTQQHCEKHTSMVCIKFMLFLF